MGGKVKSKAVRAALITIQATRPTKVGLGRRYAAPVLSTLYFAWSSNLRIKMWHKKDWKDVGFMTLMVLFPLGYDWIENSEVPWYLIALWFAIACLLFIPKQLFSYAYESDDGKVVLKESLFGRRKVIDRSTISTVELYEVDRDPIGLTITCKDASLLTFVPLSVDIELLKRIRALVLKSKI